MNWKISNFIILLYRAPTCTIIYKKNKIDLMLYFREVKIEEEVKMKMNLRKENSYLKKMVKVKIQR